MKITPHTVLDCYKIGHPPMYPVGTNSLYNNFTARSNKYSNLPERNDKIVWYGLQGFIKWFFVDLWNKEFFALPKEEVVGYYDRRVKGIFGQDIKATHVAALHDLGYLPLHIKSLLEGSRVPVQVPLYTIKETHPDFAWLVNAVETAVSSETWKAPTIATSTYAFVEMCKEFAIETTGDDSFAAVQCHDFAARGMSGVYDGAKSCSAHLLPSIGSDSTHAIDYLENYYGADSDKEAVGVSVFADEHAVVCFNIAVNELSLLKEGEESTRETKIEAEKMYIKRLITEVVPTGIVSHVSDTNFYWDIIDGVARELKEVILSRQPDVMGFAKTVFRPDTGNPEKIICGLKATSSELELLNEELEDEYDVQLDLTTSRFHPLSYIRDFDGELLDIEVDYSVEVDPNIVKGSMQILWETFGGTTSDEGYKVLDPAVGLIYGDSINYRRGKAILTRLKEMKFASTNIVFGAGSYEKQYITRDTYGFAIKATYGEYKGIPLELQKDPITDHGKKSFKGLLRVEVEDGEYVLYDQQTKEQEAQGELKTVFKDGQTFNFQTLSDIRARLASQ